MGEGVKRLLAIVEEHAGLPATRLEGAIDDRLVTSVGLQAAQHREACVLADHASRAIAQSDADRTRVERVPVVRPEIDAIQEANWLIQIM